MQRVGARGLTTRYPVGMQKQSVWILWFGSLAAGLLGSGWISTLGWGLFGLLLIAHFVEFLMNLSLFKRAGGSLVHHFVQTMIYGLFHWTPIKEQLEAGEGGGAD